MRAVFVGCTRKKIWDTDSGAGPVLARDAYKHADFPEWCAKAESSGLPWYILSTKYGLLQPGTMIEKYECGVEEALRDDCWRQKVREQVLELGSGSV